MARPPIPLGHYFRRLCQTIMIVTLLCNSRPTRIRIIKTLLFCFESKARALPGLSQFEAQVLRFRNPPIEPRLEMTPHVQCACGRQFLRSIRTAAGSAREEKNFQKLRSWSILVAGPGGCDPPIALGHYFRRLRQTIMIVTLLCNSRPTRIRIIRDPPFRFESKARASPGLSQFEAQVLRFRNPLFQSQLRKGSIGAVRRWPQFLGSIRRVRRVRRPIRPSIPR